MSAGPDERGPRAVEIRFEDGRAVLVTVCTPSTEGTVDCTIANLVARGLLSFSDRMILDQIAARVDKLARQVEAAL